MTAADWFKFVPGWFAAGVAVWTLFDKWRTRQHMRALGADDDALREHLATLRRLFKEIREESRRQDWFRAEGHRDMDATLMDLAVRRTDRVLTEHLLRIVMMWNSTRVHAPAEPGPRVRWLGDEPTPPTSEQRAKAELEREQFRKQREASEEGLQLIEGALKRLVQLERRTIGRS